MIFSFPNINTLVDKKVDHEMFSLTDGFFGYNKIMIVEEDRHKMVFSTPQGSYCHRVIPFGIKNARATYQRAYILHNYMYEIVEDYVDELIVKIKICDTHLATICKVLDRLLEYNTILNPKKCVFGFLSTKLLGFIVSKRGIQVDPNKV